MSFWRSIKGMPNWILQAHIHTDTHAQCNSSSIPILWRHIPIKKELIIETVDCLHLICTKWYILSVFWWPLRSKMFAFFSYDFTVWVQTCDRWDNLWTCLVLSSVCHAYSYLEFHFNSSRDVLRLCRLYLNNIYLKENKEKAFLSQHKRFLFMKNSAIFSSNTNQQPALSFWYIFFAEIWMQIGINENIFVSCMWLIGQCLCDCLLKIFCVIVSSLHVLLIDD